MLGVEDEVHVQQIGGFLVRRLVEQHVQEVTGVIQVGIGSHRLQTLPQSVVGGDDCGPHGRQPDSFANSCFNGIVIYVRVEPGKRRDAGAQGVHWVTVLGQQFQYLDHIIRDATVGPQSGVKISQLLLSGELGIEQQIDYFFKRRLLGQIVDVVTTIQQLAFLPVNEAGLSGVKVDILESLHNFWGHNRSSW